MKIEQDIVIPNLLNLHTYFFYYLSLENLILQIIILLYLPKKMYTLFVL